MDTKIKVYCSKCKFYTKIEATLPTLNRKPINDRCNSKHNLRTVDKYNERVEEYKEIPKVINKDNNCSYYIEHK